MNMSRRSNLFSSRGFYCAILVLLCLIVYSNTYYNVFFLDDYYRIIDNPGIQQVKPILRHFTDPTTMSTITSIIQYRPLLPLTLSFNYALFGLEPWSYHLFSNIVHAISAIFVFLFLLEVLKFRKDDDFLKGKSLELLAFFSAGIFAVHPVSGFAVNYLCARDLLMMQMFLMISFYIFVRMRRSGETWWGWVLTIFAVVLSILSKTNTAMAPLVILLFEFLIAKERPLSIKPWLRAGAFGCVGLGFVLWTKFALRFSDVGNLLATEPGERWIYFMTQLRLHLFHYIRNFFWPFKIRAIPFDGFVESPLDLGMIIAAIFIIGTLVVAWMLRKRAPIVSFCIGAYWSMFALTSSILPIHQFAADYRMYPSLPYISLVLLVIIFRFLPKKLYLTIASALLLFFGISTYAMNRNFSSDKRIWHQSVRYGTEALGAMNLGMSYRGEDNLKAKEYLELSLKINPAYYLGYINLGLCEIDLGDTAKGIALVEEGVRICPTICLDFSYYWLAIAYLKANNQEKAYEAFQNALKHNNYNKQYLFDAAFLAQTMGKYSDAIGYLDRIHQSQPNYNTSRFLAGWCYQATGELEKAVAEYKLAIEYTPDYAQTYANIGYALKDLGRCDEAVPYFKRYLEFAPNNPGAMRAIEECE